ncbi:MAG: hypothetical protein R2695_05865 [Acidimicrobiales bacterium]
MTEVFGARDEGLYDVFGIDSGEARLRRRFTEVTWHAYDNDLVVDDPGAAIAYGLSRIRPVRRPPRRIAAAFAAAIRRRCVDGVLRIRTRTGAFVCRGLRSADAR